MLLYFFFFFKQKTAYEITASDWSSDVCSSDLRSLRRTPCADPWQGRLPGTPAARDRRSEERRVGKEFRCCVDLGGRRIIKKKNKINYFKLKVQTLYKRKRYATYS